MLPLLKKTWNSFRLMQNEQPLKQDHLQVDTGLSEAVPDVLEWCERFLFTPCYLLSFAGSVKPLLSKASPMPFAMLTNIYRKLPQSSWN